METTSTVAIRADGEKRPTEEKKEDVCCAKFDPSRLDEKEIVWRDKPFARDWTWCFLYMPLNYGGLMKRACAKVEAAGAACSDDDFVMLADMRSPWSTRVCLSVTKDEIPGAEVTKISGTFLTKVFEGPYSNFGVWIKEMRQYIKSRKGENFDSDRCDMYAYYATCPGCSKKYGKNYTVLFAKVA